ncbi:MAG: hypothetical protein IKP24_01365, partial [Alphaproteobacteria bacterium]|nr:hypothetical protein [Alphaproteobacteria bacterium]
LCWENGGRRSNNGTSTRCTPSFPVRPLVNYTITSIGNNKFSAQQVITRGSDTKCIHDSTEANDDDYQWIVEIDPETNLATAFAKTPKLWPYDLGTSSTDLPTEQDWCTATAINKDNQVCPFGVKLNNQAECDNCPVGYTYTGENSNKCCPTDYPNVDETTHCCPTGYTYQASSQKCVNTSDSNDKQAYKTVMPTSSEIMGENFPEGQK